MTPPFGAWNYHSDEKKTSAIKPKKNGRYPWKNMMEASCSTKDIALNITFGCEILIEIEGVGSRIKSTLIGVDPKSYIIIKTPNVVGIQKCLLAGTFVTVRYLYLGTVYGFRSSILVSVTVPEGLLFLQFPKHIERINLRKHERITCAVPVAFGLGDFNLNGIVSDLSSGGCRLDSKIDNAVIYKAPVGTNVTGSEAVISAFVAGNSL